MGRFGNGVAFGVIGTLIIGGGAYAIKKLYARANPITYELSDDILVHGNTSLKEVALTFDDGPHPDLARPLLDLLGQHRVRATFFVVGKQVDKHPLIVRRMMNEGHEVGNHTFGHPTLVGLSDTQIQTEMMQCDKSVFKATGAHMNLFRPPGMRYDETVVRTAQDLGYTTIHWNVAAQDYRPTPPEVIEKRVLDFVRPGSVILLHSHPDTLAALPNVLASLQSQGYRFVTVSQMLARLPRPVIVKTNAYACTIEEKPTVVKHRVKPQKRVAKKASKSPAKEPQASAPPRSVDLPTWN